MTTTGRLVLATSMLLAVLRVADAAQQQQHCAMYGVCAQNDKLKMNCPYDGPPKQLNQSNAVKQIRQLCPHLFADGLLPAF